MMCQRGFMDYNNALQWGMLVVGEVVSVGKEGEKWEVCTSNSVLRTQKYSKKLGLLIQKIVNT